MKKQQITDERILINKLKTKSEAFNLIIIILLISTLIQYFFLKAPFSQIAVEFICIIVANVYIILKNIISGDDVSNSVSKKHINLHIFYDSLIIGITCAIMLAVLAGYSNLLNLALIFIITSVICFLIQLILNLINKKRQADINNKLDND